MVALIGQKMASRPCLICFICTM